MKSLWLALVLAFVFAPNLSAADKVSVTTGEGKVVVQFEGKPFAEYLEKSGTKPVLWPLIGPTGKEMTRAYPLRPDGGPGEKQDHVHHRSFWFDHGDVNGISFWDEMKGHGDIVHRSYEKVEGGDSATIITLNDWIGPDGKKVCEDRRIHIFGGDAETRWIDFEVVVTASEGPLVFGDTKEGSFGVRVAETMKEEAKLGGKIVSSTGLVNGDAWGKAAPWVDYHGPVSDEHLGIAIMSHPTSYGHPSHWHVRTYGLFAANPFGLKAFANNDPKVDGTVKLAKGETLTLRYRVLLHKGDEKTGKVDEYFQEFSRRKW